MNYYFFINFKERLTLIREHLLTMMMMAVMLVLQVNWFACWCMCMNSIIKCYAACINVLC